MVAESALSPPSPQVECRSAEGRAELVLRGELALARGRELWDALQGELGRLAAGAPLTVDLAGVTAADGGSAALLRESLLDAARGGHRLTLRGGPADLLARLGDIDTAVAPLAPPPARRSAIEQVGRAASDVIAEGRDLMAILGDWVAALRKPFQRRGGIDWSELPRLVERHGADSLPIVALISLLVGLTTAFQVARQLKLYGADVFVADLVAFSMTREMGPLMTAIVMAGRSGAGIAAELGTMAVNEEIDALRTLGLDPYKRLVVPRLLSLTLAVPALALASMAIGIVGGWLIGAFYLGIATPTWTTQTINALHFGDIGTGLVKAAVFGLTTALVACQRGLGTRGGAEGVGRSTTSSVVIVLFMLVLLDSLLTMLFQTWGI